MQYRYHESHAAIFAVTTAAVAGAYLYDTIGCEVQAFRLQLHPWTRTSTTVAIVNTRARACHAHMQFPSALTRHLRVPGYVRSDRDCQPWPQVAHTMEFTQQ